MAGRPKAERTKRAVGVRLTDEARVLLGHLAQARGITQTAIIEQLIRDEAERRHISLPPDWQASKRKQS